MPPSPRSALHARIGLRIRELRKKRRLTQAGLADRVECSAHFVSGIERGVDSPSLMTLEKIARVLDLPIAGLLDDESDEEQDALFDLVRALPGTHDAKLLTVLREVAELYSSSRNRRR